MRFKCFGRKKCKRGKSKTEEIDSQLKRDLKASNAEVKMLLLGAGESGKSTILKQMKLIHEGGYSLQERKAFRTIVYDNVYQSMRMIMQAMAHLEIPLADPEHEKDAAFLSGLLEEIDGSDITEPVVEAMKRLWQDDGVQSCVKRAGIDFYLIDPAKYFLTNLDRISRMDYVPDDTDILRCRLQTTGISETTFNIGDLTYRMFDMGGQRSERRKWIHCFENVTAIIFMVALSGYDQKLVEDDSVNRLQEALALFDAICNSRWFTNTSIILFLNKMDLFKEKIGRVPIEKYFPEYKGGADLEAACSYIRDRFLQLNQSERKQIYVHYTCATDTKQIRFVMSSVNDIIIKNNLRQAGLL